MSVTGNNFETVAPAGLLSTDSFVALAPIDAGPWLSLAYTISVATNDLDWEVFGANAADYSDEVSVQAEAQVNAGASASYAVQVAPYRYYRVKIKAAVGGSQGTATVVGIAKAS